MSDQHFKALPKVHTTYANIIKSLLPMGDHSKVSKDQLPQATYTVDALQIDEENLADYRKICGFVDDGHVPVTYFSVLSQALQMNMMVKEPFPFAVLGLVHVANSVTQYRPINQSEIVKLAVSFDNLRDHDKGQQFDFVTTVHSGDAKVWEGTSTYLSRQRVKKGEQSRENRVRTKTIRKKPDVPKNGTDEVFEVAEDIGRRYAFVSGDFNLIHLHPLSAKAFGFPKAIAHGMWSKAKCLAKLKNLPDAYQATVSFKLPILLPAEVELIAENGTQLSDEHSIFFDLYSVKNDKPHLLGEIHTLAATQAD